MKKLLLTAAAVFVTLSIYAQGTVNFQNSASTRVMNQLTGAPVAPADGIRVALFWAPLSDPNNFTQLQTSSGVGSPVAGQFFGGNRTTGNETMPGADARFIVRAWELAYGTTYEAAANAPAMGGRPALRAESPVFVLSTGGGGNPPGAPAPLTGATGQPGFTGFTLIVPEPSIIALGLIGAGSLLLFRRRK